MNNEETRRQNLIKVLSSMDKPTDIEKFLRDVMTEKEITEISARLKAAQMLNGGDKYSLIVRETGLSSRTVARISDWLKRNGGGYAKAIEILAAHHKHL